MPDSVPTGIGVYFHGSNSSDAQVAIIIGSIGFTSMDRIDVGGIRYNRWLSHETSVSYNDVVHTLDLAGRICEWCNIRHASPNILYGRCSILQFCAAEDQRDNSLEDISTKLRIFLYGE
ncbi:MAG: hypothetical protein COY38_02580 [Candidatus Aenigmarchaeota archaeon CG_4_10_14_0_8_um_filter_37_24]|nr:hypothetical protein [Candidatus Aenigmarchaeota archaeon]OIN87912.1 MAG: hypothetical protein AUJ50_02275 [Candidatus Aenigmarchaeota archaeon CG1_02_38_14]PIV67966.1 MAG: hypothetical protein COS07_05670 [Candidatus Aenigmarchaeota archaeon CG01_land_8_20_14_3_00_37_9]PIW41043.1 MAG: hypothetical protein COW21_03985 [Candidatus Aenigmarchaeota archaeon CG15_BIG_FIL_POST_REV_8_21_14_020_37_27]PIX51183.1 MAG: hypothetical protein COZ52_00105 [Candidatus Aenigmarchaeota archaeon CG_4_8_14_3_u